MFHQPPEDRAQQKVIVDAWGRPLNHYPSSSDYPSGSGDYDSNAVPKPSSSAKSGDVGKEVETEEGQGAREGVGKVSAVKAVALRTAADAAEAVAEAVHQKVGAKLLRTLETTASAAEAAAEEVVAAVPESQGSSHFVHLNRPGMHKTDADGVMKDAGKVEHFVHLNPPGKHHTDDAGKILDSGHRATGSSVQGPSDSRWHEQRIESNIERKLPWRNATASFHNHMNGRVRPRNAHPLEQVDMRAQDIKTSERQTPMTGWGLPRDRYGRATEIGYGGGFHGRGHFARVDSRTLPMGGTANRPWKASVDDPAPPSPRIWSWQGVTNPAEDAMDMRRHRQSGSFPDTPGQGWSGDSEASWREQDPDEQDYTWQLGRGLGGRDEDPEDDESLGVH